MKAPGFMHHPTTVAPAEPGEARDWVPRIGEVCTMHMVGFAAGENGESFRRSVTDRARVDAIDVASKRAFVAFGSSFGIFSWCDLAMLSPIGGAK